MSWLAPDSILRRLPERASIHSRRGLHQHKSVLACVYRLLSQGWPKKFFVSYSNQYHSVITEAFFKPLSDQLALCTQRRQCGVVPDADWLEFGARRCLSTCRSGREFLQYLSDCHETDIDVVTYFETLKSKRRLALVSEVNAGLRGRMRAEMEDPFAQFASLKEFEIFAGDGHFHAASCHDSSPTDKKAPTGHLFTLDLRCHALTHLTVGDQLNRKQEHDMRALKRLEIEVLRQGTPQGWHVGRKVLYVWDRASIDFKQWHDWKHKSAIYFLSREKSNMELTVVKTNPVDFDDPINENVDADEMCESAEGIAMRRVTYHDVVNDRTFFFLTNLPKKVAPGLVAYLYKCRWDIEKVFDELKNKLLETKAWAKSPTAKSNQAQMLCLTHNLLTLLENDLELKEGIRNEAEWERKAKTQEEVREYLAEKGSSLPWIHEAIQRITQRSVKFIRWLRNHLDTQVSWEQALAALTRIYARL